MTVSKTTAAVLLAALLAGCSVKAPEVRVTGERTALEQEVLGAYEELEEDTWMLASTRSNRNREASPVSKEKKAVLEAYRTIKFNLDDVNELKSKGLIGENNEGMLEVREGKGLDEGNTRALVDRVVSEQNEARSVIIQRMMEVNPTLNEAGKSQVLTEFAKMNQDKSPDGTWVQKTNGAWVKK